MIVGDPCVEKSAMLATFPLSSQVMMFSSASVFAVSQMRNTATFPPRTSVPLFDIEPGYRDTVMLIIKTVEAWFS